MLLTEEEKQGLLEKITFKTAQLLTACNDMVKKSLQYEIKTLENMYKNGFNGGVSHVNSKSQSSIMQYLNNASDVDLVNVIEIACMKLSCEHEHNVGKLQEALDGFSVKKTISI